MHVKCIFNDFPTLTLEKRCDENISLVHKASLYISCSLVIKKYLTARVQGLNVIYAAQNPATACLTSG